MTPATRELLARISRVAVMRDTLRELGMDATEADAVLSGMIARLRSMEGAQ